MKLNRLLILALVSFSFTSCFERLPEVETAPITEITATSAKCGGIVTNEGDGAVFAKGVCWSTSENPTLSDRYTIDGLGLGMFVSQLNYLTTGTTYHVRAYATNDHGTSYGADVEFTPQHQQLGIEFYGITEITAISAKCSATVTGDDGLGLVSKGFCWNTSGNPTINDAHTNDGTNLGEFSSVIAPLESNAKYYVRAYAQNSNNIAYGAELELTTKVLPEGAAKGLFSISETEQVYFSKGNLQYQASTDTWRFAENQWNFVGDGITGNVEGSSNALIAPDYDGWIDLFGWGTSGWDNGNAFYHPYDHYKDSIDANHGYGYGPTQNNSYNFNLNGDNAQADWGVHNAIANGGNQPGLWRTLTKNEFLYLFSLRKNASYKFAPSLVCGFYGFILLPDYWVLPDGLDDFKPNATNYNPNTYDASQWEMMENAGAVFLPLAGYREGKNIKNLTSHGDYWSSSYYNSYNSIPQAHCIKIGHSYTLSNFQSNDERYCGFSVRLVQDR